jgi:GT2 family glycosyltransferase
MTVTDPAIAVEDFAYLSQDVLIAVGRCDSELPAGDHSAPVRWTSWSDGAGEFGVLLVGTVPAARVAQAPRLRLDDRAGRTLAVVDTGRPGPDLQGLLRLHLTGLPADVRTALVPFLVEAAGALTSSPEDARLAASLHLVRQALRERLAPSAVRAGLPQVVYVDHLIALDERSFLVVGWFRDAGGRPRRLTVVSPEGARVELLERAWLHARPDISHLFPGGRYGPAGAEGTGFISFFDLPGGSRGANGWLTEMASASGLELETSAPPAVVDPGDGIGMVLGLLDREQPPADRLRSDHVRPAVDILLRRIRSAVYVRREDRYGPVPRQPEVSVIVPLYRRIDLMEHQLAEFSFDRDWTDAELIYVLDSPELDPALAEMAPHLYALYGVPFRTVSLAHTGGFATANNIGCATASGPLLLLMNSDVLPAKPGWLSEMGRFLAQTPGAGAVGPKLLFEDGTLQHAGMYFARLPSTGLWEDRHFYKGLDGALTQANVVRPVPALTGACFLIRSDVYADLGGLSGDYVQGDYEDSDLCLRLDGQGLASWYFPEVELYHLEGQSYPSAARSRNLVYNRWLHSYRWSSRIEALMARMEGWQ